jgi:type VI secretion system secreted protein Hcp
MAFDTFLKFEPPCEGEATRKGFENQIEIYSFSWGASNPTTIGSGTTGSAAGKVSISSFNIMKKTDKASPVLFQMCCAGKHFNKATVTMNKASGDLQKALPFLVYEFQEVYVESIQWSGSSGGDDTPTESVSFSFGSVKATYTPQLEGGTAGSPVGAGWDIRKNVAVGA